jgi:two-component system, NtrC family, response regulator
MDPMILVVDDDASIVASLALMLKQAGHASTTAATPAEALDRLTKEDVSLVLQDMNFSRQTTGEEGLQLLKEIKNLRPKVPVILITAWGTIPLAVRGIRSGAADFITKPWTQQQLLQSVETALELAAVSLHEHRERTISRDQLDAVYDFHEFIGNDPRLLKALEILGRVSATDASVLITGESGTGKELAAEAIHRNSRRCSGPFVKVNLGGISATLFESEMFGHVKGAFTDARQSRKGRIEMAEGGSIFLDEIGDLHLSSQVKMLRVLQDRTYEVLGSSVARTVDLRVISATNRDLADMISKGEFREDLLYRLNLISVNLPPLRERPSDIPLLACHFLTNLAKVYRKDELSITRSALTWLQGREWPGNVRQLKHLIERTVLVSYKSELDAEDFLNTLEMETTGVRRDALPDPGSIRMDELERAMILRCMTHYSGNISRVAEALGMSRPSLYRRLEKYGVKC